MYGHFGQFETAHTITVYGRLSLFQHDTNNNNKKTEEKNNLFANVNDHFHDNKFTPYFLLHSSLPST